MESRELVYLRTDGNEAIATGHLMRCLSIARALRTQNAIPVFILSDETSISLLQKMMTEEERTKRAFPIIHIQANYQDLEQEIPTMQKILSSHSISYLLVDSYFVTRRYLAAMKQLCRVAYLDDLQAFDYPVNLVINYDIIVDTGFYKNAGKVFAGGAYTPLREQFSLHPYHVWDEVKDLFLSTGGTDPFNIAGSLAAKLIASGDFRDVSIHILTGPMHVHRAELKTLSEQNDRILLHENVTDMAALMAECDLAFSAGGTTLYELCAVGVPSVSYSMADNQMPGAQAFDQAGLIPWAGDVRNNPDFFDLALKKLLALSKNPAARKEQSTKMRMAIDGAGAERIAAELLTLPPA